ncbi:MAG: hypothetical protein AB3X37_09360 [Leptothrix ochracea]|uniref:hypothetical protein n=3 Tax=Leptothrix ochracea TaxID=735331 RepID=UPI0034E2D4BC
MSVCTRTAALFRCAAALLGSIALTACGGGASSVDGSPPAVAVVMTEVTGVHSNVAEAGQPVTLVVDGRQLLGAEGTNVQVAWSGCASLAPLGGTVTSQSWQCTPMGVGTFSGSVIETASHKVLWTFQVNVSGLSVTGITPSVAIAGQPVTLVLEGTQLVGPSGMSVQIEWFGCPSPSPLGGTATTQSWQCTPVGTGMSPGRVIEIASGRILATFQVDVQPPTVIGVSPAIAVAGQPVTLVVNGNQLVGPGGMSIQLEWFGCPSPSPLGGTATTQSWQCTPVGTGMSPGRVIEIASGRILATFQVDVQPPTVIGVSPAIAVAGQPVTLVVNGNQLVGPGGMSIQLEWFGCPSPSPLGGTATTQSWQCMPVGTGISPGRVIEIASGRILATFQVDVQPPTVIGVSPAIAVAGQPVTLVVNGNQLVGPGGMSIQLEWFGCPSPSPLGGTATTQSWQCTPVGTGISPGRVIEIATGRILATFQVDVQPPPVAGGRSVVTKTGRWVYGYEHLTDSASNLRW